MRQSIRSIGAVLAAFTLLSCGPQPIPVAEEPASTDADVAAVNDVIAAWIRNVNANDADGLIGLTCPDLEVIPPQEHPVSGTEAQQMFRGFFEYATVALKPTTIEVVVGGDWAFRRYAYELSLTPKEGGDPIIMSGHGIHMFKSGHDGTWCLAKDIWNTVPPPSETP
jgi:ketosteroid isomerase-like protein